MASNRQFTSLDPGSGDDLPVEIAQPARPLTPPAVSYQSTSDAEMGVATNVPFQAEEGVTQNLRIPEQSNIVSWESDNDQLNPMNWSASKRWANTVVISVMTFST